MRFIFIFSTFAASSLLLLASPTFANEQAEVDDDVRPAPPSIGADVPLTYFGPAPSSVQKELIGPLQLLTSGTVDQDAGTTTIPLYQGRVVKSRKLRDTVAGATI
jgi:hypothetical protein